MDDLRAVLDRTGGGGEQGAGLRSAGGIDDRREGVPREWRSRILAEQSGEDLRLAQRLREAAQIDGEGGIVNEAAPVSAVDHRRQREGFEIVAGL